MFIWDNKKNKVNIDKHGVSFDEAERVFDDPDRITLFDEGHSQIEDRYYCIGKIENRIITVRFVIRDEYIRIIGAGYWRKGKKIYEERD
ncbi:MAG: BrnT family toxin [Oscillospiraceae bacterium]|nr:BrnT family toxin [Oscillospiraceae bacterium]